MGKTDPFKVWVTTQLTGTGLDFDDARQAATGSPRTDIAALTIRAGHSTATLTPATDSEEL